MSACKAVFERWRRVLCIGAPTDELARWPELAQVRGAGSQVEIKVRDWREDLPERLGAQGLRVERVDPMGLEDIFVTTVRAGGAA